ncbi:hypothetical protein PC123_g11414 [Phytophthora cactorum]|nr:hypothetical protein PC120_g5232 [Phytophthora cactorum]KAG4053438.1 hypothetical protein PC123_g11414 [Phytophthora cactorum]
MPCCTLPHFAGSPATHTLSVPAASPSARLSSSAFTSARSIVLCRFPPSTLYAPSGVPCPRSFLVVDPSSGPNDSFVRVLRMCPL